MATCMRCKKQLASGVNYCADCGISTNGGKSETIAKMDFEVERTLHRNRFIRNFQLMMLWIIAR